MAKILLLGTYTKIRRLALQLIYSQITCPQEQKFWLSRLSEIDSDFVAKRSTNKKVNVIIVDGFERKAFEPKKLNWS